MTNREQKVSTLFSPVSNLAAKTAEKWHALGESNPSFQVENLSQSDHQTAENCVKRLDTTTLFYPLFSHSFFRRVSNLTRRFRVSAPSPKSPQIRKD